MGCLGSYCNLHSANLIYPSVGSGSPTFSGSIRGRACDGIMGSIDSGVRIGRLIVVARCHEVLYGL